MSEGVTPSEWIGQRVRFRTEQEEEVAGTLEGVTEHGVIVRDDRGGPSYYGWRWILWLYPA